ncbi:MAG TPA: PEP-CTERM sorting domain-containing protein [Terriglobales bacterium]|nr:PEP-CTERM sorting domain-containing protein [Terriglobales bacterium]
MRLCALLMALACLPLPARADTIYAALTNGDIVAVDTVRLTAGVLTHTGLCWYDIAFAPDGRLYGSDAYNLYRIDPASGHATLVGAFGRFINGMTFVGDTLYGSGDTKLYTINLSSGQAQWVGNTDYMSSGDLQWFQGALYMTGSIPSDQLIRVNVLTGRGSLVGNVGFGQVYGLAATSSQLLGLTTDGDLLVLDPQTGTGTRMGSIGGSVYGASTGPRLQQVPEPGTLLLLGSGLLAIGMSRRRAANGQR